jgi:hypothetical protein
MEEIKTEIKSDFEVLSGMLDRLKNEEVVGIFPNWKREYLPETKEDKESNIKRFVIESLPLLTVKLKDGTVAGEAISKACSAQALVYYSKRQPYLNPRDQMQIKKFFIGLVEDLMKEFPEAKN